jgi:flagella basal body P-ring formation protein FlgA
MISTSNILRAAVALLLVLPGTLASLAVCAEPFETTQRIESRVREYLASRTHNTDSPATVEVGPIDARLRLPRCRQPLEAFLVPGANEFGHTTVGVRCAGAEPWTIYVTATVHVMGEVVVSARSMARGATLTRADLTTRRLDLSTLPPGAATHLAQVEGKLLKRPVAPGTVLTATMLASKPLVRRGETVTLLARVGGLDVRVGAEALASGAAGERIKVRNASSRRVVEATVVAAGLVETRL